MSGGRRLRVVLANRHYCSECDNRVFPGDSMERFTEVPLGINGERILLPSVNNRLARQGAAERKAWCFVCRKVVDSYKETPRDVEQRYLNRRGITIRYKKGGGAVLSLRRRSA